MCDIVHLWATSSTVAIFRLLAGSPILTTRAQSLGFHHGAQICPEREH